MKTISTVELDGKEFECGREPIHIPGRIQSFGVLLELEDDTFNIIQASANFTQAFPEIKRSPVGVALAEFLSKTSVESIAKNTRAEEFLSDIIEVASRDGASKWFAIVHRYQNHLILELEKLDSTSRTSDIDFQISKSVARVQRTKTLPSLLQTIVQEVHSLTNYDRVMIYRFHDDNHGEVVAEEVSPGTDSYFGLHYPASDIPPQARAIFLLNWVRMISDVDSETVEIISGTKDLLDLSRASLRSVSPVHIQYLKNMRVKASLTISLIKDGKLWGLIACHQTGHSRYIEPRLRLVCELLGRVASAEILVKTIAEEKRTKSAICILRETLENSKAEGQDSPLEVLTNLLRLRNADEVQDVAIAMYVSGRWITVGQTPSESQMNGIASWLDVNHPDEAVFHTNRLPVLYPEAHAYKDIASGLLSISLPKGTHNYIFWFKPEVLQTVSWAGEPQRSEDFKDKNDQLRPRSSFREWKETVKSHSIPWSESEVNEALKLRSLILALDLKRQIKMEQSARRELEEVSLRKEEVLSIVSHDLKNPLAALRLSLKLFQTLLSTEERAKIATVTRAMENSVASMNFLIGDLLSITKIESGTFSLDKTYCKTSSLLEQTSEQFAPLANEKNISFICEPLDQDIELFCDRERILQVISNLVGNALKFSPLKSSVTLAATLSEREILFGVRDSGPGISKGNLPFIFDRFWQAQQNKRAGTGLGLAIAKGIVEAHRGRIWAESNVGSGTNFYFSLPIG